MQKTDFGQSIPLKLNKYIANLVEMSYCILMENVFEGNKANNSAPIPADHSTWRVSRGYCSD